MTTTEIGLTILNFIVTILMSICFGCLTGIALANNDIIMLCFDIVMFLLFFALFIITEICILETT